MTLSGTLRAALAALVLGFIVQVAAPHLTGISAQAQTSAPAPNPTTSAVREADLLKALRDGGSINGRVTIPDGLSATLIQPEGMAWRTFHQTTLAWIGAISILGMLALLTVFYLVRGRVRIAGGLSGRTILRFGWFDRFVHWMTASAFIVLALSGLNISFGKYLLLPLFGPETFTAASQAGKIAHNYIGFPFMLGIALMLLIWVKDNIPGRIDLEWLKAGGGILDNGKHPPARRFNAGQKIIFWTVILGGAALSLSGWFLLFPFTSGNSVGDQQFWNIVHGVVSALMVAIMLAHAYIGSIGMEGAFDAMGSGQVDLNWAREHHSLWVEEEMSKGHVLPKGMQPAE